MMARVAVRPTLIVACGALVAASVRATAQSGAVLRGVVYDSLISAAPLAGAEVWIEGTNRTARTDAAGRFELAALAAGRYRLAFDHPVLDSTGLAAPPVVVDVAAGGATAVTLATPSPATAHRTLCPHDPWQKTGAILGLVRDAADGKPLPDVAVTAHWTIYVLGAGPVRPEPGTTAARSDGSGRVLLCNVPTDVAVLVQGRAGEGPVGMVLVDLADRAFGRAALDLALAVTPGARTGAVRGAVSHGPGGRAAPQRIGLSGGAAARARADRQSRARQLLSPRLFHRRRLLPPRADSDAVGAAGAAGDPRDRGLLQHVQRPTAVSAQGQRLRSDPCLDETRGSQPQAVAVAGSS